MTQAPDGPAFPSPVLSAPLTGRAGDDQPTALFMADPEPAPGCADCAELMQRWRLLIGRTSSLYDPTKATDCAVLISRHPTH